MASRAAVAAWLARQSSGRTRADRWRRCRVARLARGSYAGAVLSERIDPRDVEWEQPTPAYRVYFWSQVDPRPGLAPADLAWRCEAHRVSDVHDVHEVIAWVEGRLPAGGRYVLYVEESRAGRPGLVRLAGDDPTES